MNGQVYEPLKALECLSKLFESLEIPYFLVGSFASGIRGQFRATNDIDIVCNISKEKTHRFIAECQKEFYADSYAIQEALSINLTFNIIHNEAFIKIDIFPPKTDLEINEFDRSERILLPNSSSEIYVASIEYNIVAKFRWYLLSGRQLEKQIEDIKGMLFVGKSIDYSYIDLWLEKLLMKKNFYEKFGEFKK